MCLTEHQLILCLMRRGEFLYFPIIILQYSEHLSFSCPSVLFEHEQNAESLSRQNSKYEIEARLCPQREERQEKLTVIKPA